jgi:zinc ribbon protein
MYCERCGTQIQPGVRFCSGCGRSFEPSPVLSQQTDGRVHRHLRLLAVLWMAMGGLRLFAAAALYTIGRFVFVRIPLPMLPDHFLGGLVTMVASFFLFKAILAFIAGWGLLERQSWARMYTLVLGFLALLLPPVGTALGIYTLWVLLPEQSQREYQALAQTA